MKKEIEALKEQIEMLVKDDEIQQKAIIKLSQSLKQIRAMIIPFTNNGHWLYKGSDLLPILEYINEILGDKENE